MNEKRKKISIRIIGKLPPPIGGVTISTQRLYQRLKNSQIFDVYFSSLNKIKTNDAKIGIIHNYISWMFKKLFCGFDEDIVHYQGSDFKGLMFLIFVLKIHQKTKLVWSIHSEYLIPSINRYYYSWLINFALKKIDFIIADNNNIKSQLLQKGIKSKVIFPFLMPNNFVIDKNDGYKSNYPVILFNAYKIVFNQDNKDVYGLDTLLEAFSILKNKVTLVLLIPSKSLKTDDYIESLMKENKLEKNSNIIIISDEKINALNWISNSDIFVRPTITDGDALSLREALYLGVPAIASDCVPRPENTILFKTEDYKDLSLKIEETLNKVNEIKKSLKANKYDAFNKFVNFYVSINKGKNI